MQVPPNWDINFTSEGELYYINHLTKMTQWEPPPLLVDRVGRSGSGELHEIMPSVIGKEASKQLKKKNEIKFQEQKQQFLDEKEVDDIPVGTNPFFKGGKCKRHTRRKNQKTKTKKIKSKKTKKKSK